MLNFIPLLDIARRIPRTPVRNVPDSIAASNDVLPPTTMDTITASTTASTSSTGFDFNTIMLICGLVLLIASCMLIASRVRKQRLA